MRRQTMKYMWQGKLVQAKQLWLAVVVMMLVSNQRLHSWEKARSTLCQWLLYVTNSLIILSICVKLRVIIYDNDIGNWGREEAFTLLPSSFILALDLFWCVCDIICRKVQTVLSVLAHCLGKSSCLSLFTLLDYFLHLQNFKSAPGKDLSCLTLIG